MYSFTTKYESQTKTSVLSSNVIVKCARKIFRSLCENDHQMSNLREMLAVCMIGHRQFVDATSERLLHGHAARYLLSTQYFTLCRTRVRKEGRVLVTTWIAVRLLDRGTLPTMSCDYAVV